MNLDIINGSFEGIGAICSWANVYKYTQERIVRGIYWPSVIFYAVWGAFNLIYYPSLNQPFSFWGGLVLLLGNLAWILLVSVDKIRPQKEYTTYDVRVEDYRK